jgi:hypothetical protein
VSLQLFGHASSSPASSTCRGRCCSPATGRGLTYEGSLTYSSKTTMQEFQKTAVSLDKKRPR